ncbi:hypothetical protein ACE1CI_33955 [Aerosakkonemataceae cyanobacterium BLCC-F50]|uniref:Uncharacterized protein n=1 Tax=Floridaenema flaviceps BLCC-F50 TaxID=3153642 RepID=A0ABV4Y1X3_9CYAN
MLSDDRTPNAISHTALIVAALTISELSVDGSFLGADFVSVKSVEVGEKARKSDRLIPHHCSDAKYPAVSSQLISLKARTKKA